MKKLVVYYSFEGGTKIIGDAIAEEIGADILELKLMREVKKKEYMKTYLGPKQVLMKTAPILKPYKFKPQDYDLIIIGTPIWAGTFAPAIRTFFTLDKFNDKMFGLYYCFAVQTGLISKHLRKELKNNIILDEIGFKNPLETYADKGIERAKKWAKNLLNNIQ